MCLYDKSVWKIATLNVNELEQGNIKLDKYCYNNFSSLLEYKAQIKHRRNKNTLAKTFVGKIIYSYSVLVLLFMIKTASVNTTWTT